MVSHRAINDIVLTPKKEVHFFFFSVYCIVFNCSWQLIFDKKQKSCVKRIHLITDDGLFHWKAFYTVKLVSYSSSKVWNMLKVNKDTRTMPMTSLWYLYC